MNEETKDSLTGNFEALATTKFEVDGKEYELEYHALRQKDTLVVTTAFPDESNVYSENAELNAAVEASIGEEGIVAEIASRAFPGESFEDKIISHIRKDTGLTPLGKNLKEDKMTSFMTVVVKK